MIIRQRLNDVRPVNVMLNGVRQWAQPCPHEGDVKSYTIVANADKSLAWKPHALSSMNWNRKLV